MLLVAGACLAVVPWLHPNNTCKDWLQKWGQLAAHPMWLPIHQLAMAGFALAAAAAVALAVSHRRSALGLFAGSALASGLAIQSMLVLLHATVSSRLGQAFNAATTDADRQMWRVAAEAVVGYDVGCSLVAAALLSAGAALISVQLVREGALSPFAGLVFAGVGCIWGFQALGVFGRLHVPTTEWIPYTSLALWTAGLGLLLLARRRPTEQTARGDARHYDKPLSQEP